MDLCEGHGLVCGVFRAVIRLIRVGTTPFLRRRDSYHLNIRASRARTILLLLVAALLVTACVGQRDGVSWADLTLVERDGSPAILIAYKDYMVLIDPVTGQPVSLLNSEGEVRLDEDGNPRQWIVQNDGSEFYSTPLFIDDDTLLVADYNNRLLNVNYESARVNDPAGFPVDGHVITDLITNSNGEVVYLPFTESNLTAIDTGTFAPLWTFETERGVWSDPVYNDGVLYFASIDHHLYALDAGSGDLIWDINLQGGIAAQPLLTDNHFYVGTLDRKVFKISLDGEIIGEPFETEDWVWSTPVLYEDTLYVTDLSGFVYALDASGDVLELVWRVQPSGDGIRPSPVVTEDMVIVADRDGRIHWLSREDGQPVQIEGENGLEPLVRDVDAEVLSNMLLLEWGEGSENEDGDQRSDLLLVSTVNDSRVLVAFTLEDGARRWDYGR